MLLAIGCSRTAEPPPNPGPKHSQATPPVPNCRERLDDPPVGFPLPPAPPPPTSTLSARVEIDKQALEQRIAAGVPVELARAKNRSVGAAGKATYRVWRGQPNVALRGDVLSVYVPITADIEVCKPVGPVCVRYGACQPTFDAVVQVRLDLDDEGEIPKTRTSIRSGRRCSIVGFDVTHRLLSEARRQLAQVKVQLDDSLPKIRPLRERLRDESPFVAQLEPEGCLVLDPDSIGLSPVVHRGKLLIAHVVASGRAHIEPRCPAERPRATSLIPITRLEEPLPRTEVHAPYELPWADVQRQLNDALASHVDGELRLEQVTVAPARIDNQNLVALRARLSGSSCGVANFAARPAPSDQLEGTLRWTAVAPLGAASPASARAVERILNALAVPRVPFDAEYIRDEGLYHLKQAGNALPQGASVEHDLELGRHVVVTPTALRWVAELRGEAKLRYSDDAPAGAVSTPP